MRAWDSGSWDPGPQDPKIGDAVKLRKLMSIKSRYVNTT